MENELQNANCSSTHIPTANSKLASKVSVSSVRLVPKVVGCHTPNVTNANDLENIDTLDNSDLDAMLIMDSDKNEYSSGFTNENAIGLVETPPPDASFNSIMDVCSTAAQHLKQTITEVLNSRNDEPAVSSPTVCGAPVTLEESLKEKLADFEQTCRIGSIPEPPDQETMVTEVNGKVIDDVALLENGTQETSDCPENSTLADKNSNDESSVILSECPASIKTHRHPSCEESDSQSSDISVTNKTSVPSEETEKTHKKVQKNTTGKKKGEKTVDQILKSLSSYPTAEEKLQALCRKQSETVDDLRSSDVRLKQSERQVIQLAREKEQLQAEHNRMILAKSRLESLCRELQRQNKAVKEESLLRIREEEEKRKDVASKFQTTLNEISTLMQEHSKKNLQLKEENSELAKKLKTLVEHYEMWEKHMEKVVHQKDLESQLAKAKQAKTNLQLKQETEKFLREKQSLLENMSELQKKCTQLTSNEIQLRSELGNYTSKYEEFQTVLSKSNQVFATFKTDMETTSKKIKKLEKETNIWKQKWENSNKSLLEMVTDKQKRDKELVAAQQRILTLEKLCRALQAERNDLQSQVKGTGEPIAAAE